ncbi:hypothetical protein G5V58_24760 [Nocardioides anomalus]|uniref:Uncharacterized protein n=1 Tax=Nocardioides anomalus TaxID=2712223 RepID=A0A6G6WJM0_9ACTN|nr:hypothetical protein [Nocardioides anomalus]QIG45528.1 hypothetical protein G5V58_24760 [Nocardioides anomalus]
MAGLYARPSAAAVGEACAAHVSGEVVAWVAGKTLNARLLYVVTPDEVAVLRLGRFGIRPQELLGRWRRGAVETEDGIASVRVGAYRAKVRLVDRRLAREVARLGAAVGPG